MLKRTARNTKGEAWSKPVLTTTNATPQISEQNISDKSACSLRFIREFPRLISPVYPQKAGPSRDKENLVGNRVGRGRQVSLKNRPCGHRRRCEAPRFSECPGREFSSDPGKAQQNRRRLQPSVLPFCLP